MGWRWFLMIPGFHACAMLHGADAYLSPDSLQAAARYARAEAGASLIVVQHGKTLLREFHNGHRENEPLRIFSGTKFFWCLAALHAQSDHLLSLDECVAGTITEWNGSSKQVISVRQLLDFASGLPPMNELHEDGVSNRDALAIRASLVRPPGTRFIYGPASLQVFHELLRRKLRKVSPTEYLERKVLSPLGLGPQRYVADNAGNPLLAAGFMLTADQWLGVGRLMLREGRPVVSKEAFRQCITGSAACPAFGLGIWNNRAAASPGAREVNIPKEILKKWPEQDWRGACICASAPADLIASIGSSGQRIYVVPSMELIVVRQGTSGTFADAPFLRLLFRR